MSAPRASACFMLSFISFVSVVGATVTAFANADEAVPKLESPEHLAAQQFVTSLVQGSAKDAVDAAGSNPQIVGFGED